MIRRLLSKIVIAVLLVVWGCSAWQIQQLQTHVRALEIENRSLRLKTAQALHSQKDAGVNPSWLSLADEHIDRAGDVLAHADPACAEREMAAGTGAMQRALRSPVEQTEAAIVRAHAQVKQLNMRVTTLQAQMDTFSANSGPQIHLLRAQADQIEAQAQSYWQAHHD